MATVYIVRHGNTFAPAEPPRRVGSGTDLPLVASGVAQAQALAVHFEVRGVRFTQALTSPLQRARATAAAILARQPQPPALSVSTLLTEIDHGPDENQPEDAVRARVGQEALTLWDEHAIPPPGWQVEAEARIVGWRDLFGQLAGTGEVVLAATSNGAARFALMAANASPLGPSGLKLATGAYGVLEVGTSAEVRVAAWNARP
jgi:probable phosphoglycerate mutase